jgi:hypothetical protein
VTCPSPSLAGRCTPFILRLQRATWATDIHTVGDGSIGDAGVGGSSAAAPSATDGSGVATTPTVAASLEPDTPKRRPSPRQSRHTTARRWRSQPALVPTGNRPPQPQTPARRNAKTFTAPDVGAPREPIDSGYVLKVFDSGE